MAQDVVDGGEIAVDGGLESSFGISREKINFWLFE
jgi:hypothetical protein